MISGLNVIFLLQLLLWQVLASRVKYTIPMHRKLAEAGCSAIQNEFPLDLNCEDGMMAKGIVWPDCPKTPEKDDLSNSCKMIGSSEVGVHTGLKEMAKQGISQAYYKQKDKWKREDPYSAPDPEHGGDETRENGMSNYRLFQQHWHGSPPPPVDQLEGRLVDNNPWHDQGRQFAVVTNVDLRNKMLEQQGVWYCKAMSLAAASHKMKDRSSCSTESPRNKPVKVGVDDLNCGESNYAWQLSRFDVGKMLHMVTDSFSRSHVRRHFCPGTGLEMEAASGDCFAVDPGDAHDAAVKRWKKYRGSNAQASELAEEAPAPAPASDDAPAPAPAPDDAAAPAPAPAPAKEEASFLER